MAIPSLTYSLSRKYPYKWFTWFIVVGGVCATVLFSILNLAADGYVLNVDYTLNYNETMGVKRWTRHFPFSVVDKVATTCQSSFIPLNSKFLTNNSALSYTLTGVSNVNGNLPALEYTNNFLQDCSMAFMEIDLESTQRTAAQQGWTTWGPKAHAQVACSINNDRVPTSINITVDYEFLTPTIETGTAFSFVQPPSDQTSASLWWGQSLLSWYWLNLASTMTANQDDGDALITQGSLIFITPDKDDMTDLGFFSGFSYHFTEQSDGVPICCINPAGHDYAPTVANLAANNVTPNIWIEADSLAKAFYATIMADLGQNSTVNMLANSSALEYFSANLTDTPDGQDISVVAAWHRTNPAMQSYLAEKDKTGPLNITPSVILQQYLCQIPKLKSGGSLFVTILIADLVFLQALWKIVGWITVWRLQRSDSQANYCEGCAVREVGIELQEGPRLTTQRVVVEPEGARSLLKSRAERYISSETTEQLLSPE